MVNRKRSGRQRITSATENRRIATTSKRNRQLTAPKITNSMNSSREGPISVTTVNRRSMEAAVCGKIAARKPLYWSQNKKRRQQWAKQHEQLTVDDWKRVLGTNESNFQIFGSK